MTMGGMNIRDRRNSHITSKYSKPIQAGFLRFPKVWEKSAVQFGSHFANHSPLISRCTCVLHVRHLL